MKATNLFLDGADACQLLIEVGPDLPRYKPVAVMLWILEGYSVEETAEGILSSARIEVP